ncbi:MAG TPA: AIPR family protein [Flavobacterium sp.]|nr:MAG: AIPR protein [Bacteroidetes bacterium ADurb.Bin028]HPW99098.1 AIPR family protein [Flavobacterium sp.]
MAQKFDIGLNAKINEFAKKFSIARTATNDSDVFEDFGNYVIASNLLEEEIENIKSVSTNKAQGIDGVVIIINNILVSEEADLEKFGPTESIKFKIGFIQSTIENSFNEQKLSAFTDEVVKFLIGEIAIEPYSTIYKKLLDETGNFIDRIEETPHVSLFFLSARTSHNIDDDKIKSEENKITSRNEIKNKCILDKFFVLQNEDIKNEYEKISKFHTVQLKLENSITLSPVKNVEISLLATIKFLELKKLILTSDNNLKEKLFVENVRNYIGNTPVNTDIKKTLDDTSKRSYFPFLNNGLAIICDKIERHPVKDKVFLLTFPRIINGCQTTNELFKKYKDSSDEKSIDEIEVVAKIISTEDNDLKKMIIYAANNQNSIDRDLQSLNEFHEKIETYFLGKEEKNFHLYFERLRGQHANIIPPYSKINIETLARVFISVFLKKPHEMKSNAISVIEKFQKEGKIFNSSHDKPNQYYYCSVLWYWFNYLLINRNFALNTKSMDMHVLMACDILLEKKNYSSIDEKINYLGETSNAMSIFSETVTLLNEKSYLFERRGFYSNPKTERLINEINGINTITNTAS